MYDDELLYSGIARYHVNAGNKTQRQTIEDLFGSRLVCATTDLPSHIDILASNIQNHYSCEQLIQNHTLFPYYAYFMSQDKIDLARLLMIRGANHGKVHAILGLMATKVKAPKHLRFCRECYNAEAKEYEPYWHRTHQLPGVSVCPLHKQPLSVSHVEYSTQNHKFEFVALSKIREEHYPVVDIDTKWTKNLEYIAEQSASMLLSSSLQMKKMSSYKKKLCEQAYLTAQGRVKFTQLINDFRDFYSDVLLKHLNCEVTDVSETWLHKLIRSPKEIIHPLRHLLLLRFLEAAHDSSARVSCSPFGDGSWPCLNKAADHYYLDIIKKCSISRCSKTGLPVGTFQCSCGFVYSRRGPDRSFEDKYQIGRIKGFGHVWYEKLKEINTTSLSLRKKAEILGVDPGTIKNQTEVLLNFREVPYKNKLISSKASKTIIVIESAAPRSQKVRVDWKVRDEILLYVVKRAIEEIRSMPEPHRISLASIARTSAVGGFSLKIVKGLNKLPNTKAYIESFIDTTESYQVRRLLWAADKLHELEGKIVGWRLMKLAGLNHPLRSKVLNVFTDLIRQNNY
ncbi:hypothetical protein BBG47_18820 [Paenibacillus sp. KS1]|uniref:TnsD family Tn7-like transposition protein n=1 Tax=Paenibacillus sp. KS1 TaxID=1849249 RepID=UPI00080649AA|nr:TnsD family Tn7-like transposition protein [Paenibacillus sp. KS1]OBY77997.1 hypothetical protein BBG47_18820 [Paenibacillus sp. KS1]